MASHQEILTALRAHPGWTRDQAEAEANAAESKRLLQYARHGRPRQHTESEINAIASRHMREQPGRQFLEVRAEVIAELGEPVPDAGHEPVRYAREPLANAHQVPACHERAVAYMRSKPGMSYEQAVRDVEAGKPIRNAVLATAPEPARYRRAIAHVSEDDLHELAKVRMRRSPGLSYQAARRELVDEMTKLDTDDEVPGDDEAVPQKLAPAEREKLLHALAMLRLRQSTGMTYAEARREAEAELAADDDADLPTDGDDLAEIPPPEDDVEETGLVGESGLEIVRMHRRAGPAVGRVMYTKDWLTGAV